MVSYEDYVKIVKETGVGCAYDEVKDMSIDEATEYLFTCRMMSPIEDIEKNEEDRRIKYEEYKIRYNRKGMTENGI